MRVSVLVACTLVLILSAPTGRAAGPAPTLTISLDPEASALERFAARELQRYVYLRTGERAAIERAGTPPAHGFLVATRTRPLASRVDASALPAHSYRLATERTDGRTRIAIVGADPLGTLYGVYRVAEKLGVRFYADRDVIPDSHATLETLQVDETGQPLFPVRGLQPFHDFAEGPDWWNADEYRAMIGQLAKLRMNFLGLHTYPESDVGPEPTVWIGTREDLEPDGRVRRAYPASYHTTGRGGKGWWAYAPQRTSDFAGGAAALFERDDFGADVMTGHPYEAQTPESAAQVFNRTGQLLGEAFAEARRLGVLTCIGTETPLTIPKAVKDELLRRGRDPADPALIRDLYRVMFERIARVSPADYYWLWTPENWTWEGNRPEHFATTAADIQAALDALKEMNSPMKLATCGWVLGPQHDRPALDRLLPPDSPMSAINSSVGHVAIDRGFTRIQGRPLWAIPWLENDGTLTTPELWTGRMRYDAVDARRLGCTGLIGIHWRTGILAPGISALASAAWDQSWVPAGFDTRPIPPLTASGATGGRVVAGGAEITGEGEIAPYRTNRVGMPAYDMLVPNGTYEVRLGFSELQQRPPGSRVFDVKLNGATAISRLDVAAEGGDRHGFARTVKPVRITEGRLLIEFGAHAGEPSVASIEVNGVTDVGQAPYSRRINCGGPLVAGFEADELTGQPRPPTDRTMPVAEFYRDFAASSFGPEAAEAIARVFTDLDGVALPTPTLWIDGPGDIRRHTATWAEESPRYAFVDRLEALRPQVHGAANLDRYDYWLNQFRSGRLIAQLGCVAGALDREMEAVAQVTDAAAARARTRAAALPLRLELARLWTQLLQTEMAGVSNSGELGSIANLEQRSRTHARFLTRHDEAMVKQLGHDLPLEAAPGRDYAGPARIVVPTVRTSALPGERLRVRTLLIAADRRDSPELCWRWLGEQEYRREPLHHVGRGVYQAVLPALDAEHSVLEYHLEAGLDGAARRWPVSDRGLDQTVVLLETEQA